MKRSIAIGVLCFAVVTVLIGLVYANDRASVSAKGQDDLDRRAQRVANALDRMLQMRMTEVFTFAALPSMRGFAASEERARPSRMAVAQAELQSIAAADPNVRAAFITDVAGKVILTTDSSMNAAWGVRVFIKEALAGHLSASVPARDYGEISQYYSAPILNNARDVAGTLVVRVAVQEMWDVAESEASVVVVDDNGVRIADSSDSPMLFAALAPLSVDQAAALISEQRYGSEVSQVSASNLTALANAVRLARPTETFASARGSVIHASMRKLKINEWSVVALEDEGVMLASAYEFLKSEILIAAMSVVGALGGMAGWHMAAPWRGTS